MMQSMPSHRVLLAFAVGALLALPTWSRASDALSSIPGQVAVAAYVQEWGQVLWGLAVSQTGMLPDPVGDPVTAPDGSVSQTYVSPDGTVFVMTAFADCSTLLVMTLPDGTVQAVRDSTPYAEGSTCTVDSSFTSSDGTAVTYSTVLDTNGTPWTDDDDTTVVSGSAQLPRGVTQTFRALIHQGQTEIQSAQSDHSVFSLTVPLEPELHLLPDFLRPAAGLFADDNSEVAFTLTATPAAPGRWAALVCDAGGGVTGTFGLNPDFSGFGQVEQAAASGTTLAALVSWTRSGDVSAYSLDGQNLQLGPAGAAVDFLQHRWQTLAAALAGTQGASSARPDPRRSRFRPRDRSKSRAAPRRVVHASAATNSRVRVRR
jgi:hypothetical protein